MNASLFITTEGGGTYPTLPQISEPQDGQGVGKAIEPLSDKVDSALSDADREEAIHRAGKAVEKHMAARKAALSDYDITNSLLDKADADRAHLMAQEAARLMADLIRGRSPGRVARMEQERGLSGW